MAKRKEIKISYTGINFLNNIEINQLQDEYFGYANREIKGDDLKCKDIDLKIKEFSNELQKLFIEKNKNFFIFGGQNGN